MKSPVEVWIEVNRKGGVNDAASVRAGVAEPAVRYLRADLKCGECNEYHADENSWCEMWGTSLFPAEHPACMAFNGGKS